jgi:hypothetical protein
MEQEDKGKSAQELFYDAMGCGCCTNGNDPEWEDVESALREQIAQEIESLKPNYDLFLPTGIAASYAIDDAAKIARGK